MTSRSKLLCFDPPRYFKPLDDNDRQCIAPTMKGLRCKWKMPLEETEELRELLEEISQSSLKDRNSIFERITLLRTCGECHRQKLEAEKQCLRELAARLAERMAEEGLVPISFPPDLPILVSPPRARESSVSTDQSSPGRRRYTLRPRLEVGKTDDLTTLTESASIFVPYPSDPRDNINAAILQSVPVRHSPEGYVYAFTWPANPGFVKIGYTTSVTRRMEKWEECHPGLAVIHAVKFQFPHHLERLIHLELAEHRQQITLCSTCSGTHYEWFKTSASYVVDVINHWKAVAEKAPLYTTDRAIAGGWLSRIANLKQSATGMVLLELLFEERDLVLSMFGDFMRMVLGEAAW